MDGSRSHPLIFAPWFVTVCYCILAKLCIVWCAVFRKGSPLEILQYAKAPISKAMLSFSNVEWGYVMLCYGMPSRVMVCPVW